uniref:Uncharacterized protein n=1 Tax=Rhizophora mucronata TaxID=61149 RepID=A0A2P2PBA0_RHIMU
MLRFFKKKNYKFNLAFIKSFLKGFIFFIKFFSFFLGFTDTEDPKFCLHKAIVMVGKIGK